MSKHDLSEALPQLKIAISILKKIQPEKRRENTLNMVKQLCAEELNLLQEIPHVKDLFSPEDADLIQEIIDYNPAK